MKNRVGLITYHFLHNYGTMLQAYALQSKIRAWGYEAEYIDYRFKELTQSPSNRLITRFKRVGYYLGNYKYYYIKAMHSSKMSIRKAQFDDFYLKNIRTGLLQYATLQELEANPPEYDIYIVGSDQVWNPNLSCSSPAYFLSFIKKDDSKKAAYAPSIGVASLTTSQEQKIARHIRKFDFLSCREITGSRLLENMGGRNVLHVLDPTFLLEADRWEDVMVRPKIAEPYILCYFLGDTKHPREYVRELEKKTGIKAYYIPSSPLDMARKTAIFDAGPAEFLGLIRNASYVCTDSFHGSVFSIIFKKQFYSFCKRSDNEQTSDNIRIKELLKSAGLEARLINPGQQMRDDESNINFDLVNSHIMPMKERSEEYLLEILRSKGQTHVT